MASSKTTKQSLVDTNILIMITDIFPDTDKDLTFTE